MASDLKIYSFQYIGQTDHTAVSKHVRTLRGKIHASLVMAARVLQAVLFQHRMVSQFSVIRPAFSSHLVLQIYPLGGMDRVWDGQQ